MKLTVKDTCLAFSTSKYFLFFVFFLKWWEHDMGMQWKWSETGAPVLLFCRDYSLTWPIENAKTVSMFSLSYLFCFLVEEVSELRVNEVFGYLTERSQQTNFHSFNTVTPKWRRRRGRVSFFSLKLKPIFPHYWTFFTSNVNY